MADQTKERYQRSFKKYGVSPKSLAYWNQEAIDIRYQELLKDIEIEGKSILDVGSGFGDIIPHLKRKATKFNFIGIDLVPEFVGVARKKYPKHEFIIGDYFGRPLQEKFDIVFTSGTLNSGLPKKDPVGYRKKAIKTMLDHAREVVSFNMAGGYQQPENVKNYRVWYANSLEILKYCLSLTPKVIFRHHYRKNDFTIIMYK